MIARETFIAHEAGTLDAEEMARFQAELAADTEALNYWMEQQQMDEALRVLLGAAESRARLQRSILQMVQSPGADEIKQSILSSTAREGSRLFKQKVFSLIAAAAAVVAFMTWISADRGLATVVAAENCTVKRAGITLMAAAGMTLHSHDSLRVTGHPPAHVTIQYQDETRLSLEAGSDASLSVEKLGGKRVTLTNGRLTAKVSRQPSGIPMMIHTPQAVLTVLGTEFLLAVKSGKTQLQVNEGSVRMTRQDGSQSVDVAAGQSATFIPDTVKPPVAKPGSMLGLSRQPGTRSPFMWPFAADSMWNQSLGDTVKHEPLDAPAFNPHTPLGNAIIGRPVFDEVENFPSHQVLVNGQPVFDVLMADKWKPGFAAAWPVLVIINTRSMRVAELRGADRLPSGDFVALDVHQDRLDAAGSAGLTQSGTSALGGLIRYGELTRGIPHALAVSVLKTSLGGNLNLRTRLALPPALDLAGLGVGKSGAGFELARALQDYGAFITETGDEPFAFLAWYENIPPDFASQVAVLLPYLQVVTSTSGTPRRPAAPPFEK